MKVSSSEAPPTMARPNPLIVAQQSVPAVFGLEELNGLNLYEITVAMLQGYLSDGQFTSLEYVQFCLERIRRVNPHLECIIEVNSDASDIAARLDDERGQVSRLGNEETHQRCYRSTLIEQ